MVLTTRRASFLAVLWYSLNTVQGRQTSELAQFIALASLVLNFELTLCEQAPYRRQI